MLVLTVPKVLEEKIKNIATIENYSIEEMTLKLINESVNKYKMEIINNEENVLKIHEELMDKYSVTFEKLAQ